MRAQQGANSWLVGNWEVKFLFARNPSAEPRKTRYDWLLEQVGVALDCSTPPAPVLTSLAAMAAPATFPRPLVSPAARDRKFYTGIAIVMLFTALIGFSRTYFLGLISGH